MIPVLRQVLTTCKADFFFQRPRYRLYNTTFNLVERTVRADRITGIRRGPDIAYAHIIVNHDPRYTGNVTRAVPASGIAPKS